MRTLVGKAVVSIAVIASLLVASACSSSGGAKSSAPSSSSSLKGAPIVLGSICSCTGVQAAALGKIEEVIKAWAASVNAGKGLAGHPVKLIVKDDGADPTKSLQAAKELVQQDKVVAIVGEVSVADQAWASYVQSKGIPVVGGLSLEAPFLSNPDFFPSGSSLPVTSVGQAQILKDLGDKKMGLLYCAESPICAQITGVMQLAIGLVGGGIDLQPEKVSSSAPNYTSACLSLKNGGVDSTFVATNGDVAVRVVDNCTRLNFKPQQVTQVSTFTAKFLTDKSFNDTYVLSPNAAFTDTTIPAIKEMTDAINKYSPGTTSSPQYTADTEFAWAGGKLLQRAVQQSGSTDVTSASILSGLYALKDETLGGLSGPLNFTKGKPSLPACYFVAQVKDGRFTYPKGTGPICLTATQVQALGAALAKLGG